MGNICGKDREREGAPQQPPQQPLQQAAATLQQRNMLVEKAAPTTSSLHGFAAPTPEELQEGQVLVHVVKVVVTSNTVTYALAGMTPLKYFAHWPVPAEVPEAAKYARCPAWGTGVVVASKCPEVPKGKRLHGFFTFSQMVVLTPTGITEEGFADGVAHRAEVIGAYKWYTYHSTPVYSSLSTPDEEDWYMSTGMLFTTGWAMSRLADVHTEGPTAIVLTSASSRTAQGASFTSKFHESKLKVIGLTSAGNLDYVRGLAMHDAVHAYSDVASLEKEKVVICDMAGNSGVLQALYQHYGENVVACHKVGGTHADMAGLAGGQLDINGGAKPAAFLVFDALKQLKEVLGKEAVAEQLAEATSTFKEKMTSDIEVVRKFGPEAVLALWTDVAGNKVPPGAVNVASMWPEAEHEPKA